MGGQTLFVRPYQSLGHSGLVPFPRSQTVEWETAVAQSWLNYMVTPDWPFGQYIPYATQLDIISMPKQSENTGFTLLPRSLENKSMTFEKSILCCSCLLTYSIILKVHYKSYISYN